MPIKLKTPLGISLTHTEVDTNFSSLFYSASMSGSFLVLHTTGSTVQAETITPINVGLGSQTTASGIFSNARGLHTITSGPYQHTQGQYNIPSSVQSAFIHGNGASDAVRSNLIFAAGTEVQITGSLKVTQGITGSLLGTASYVTGSVHTSANPALSSSYALTSSHALTASYALNGGGGGGTGDGFPYTGSAQITGSLAITGSLSNGIESIALGKHSHAEGNGPSTGTTKAYLANSVVNGVITLDSSYGNIATTFLPLNYLWIDTDPYDGVTNSVIHQVATSQYTAPNTIINVSDLTFNLINDGLVINTSISSSGWTGNVTTAGDYAHVEGSGSIAIGNASHAEGLLAMSFGGYSHAEGYYTKALRGYSHAEGREAIAAGRYSHAEGISTQAIGTNSHAEGDTTQATGNSSHAEGQQTVAAGDFSHAEGKGTIAIGNHSHAEGLTTQTTVFAEHSHVEGFKTIAAGRYQHVQGQYNISSAVNSAFIVGNGLSNQTRSNLIFAAGNTVTINSILQLTPVTSFPATAQHGMIVAVGSPNSILYYYNGTTWNALF